MIRPLLLHRVAALMAVRPYYGLSTLDDAEQKKERDKTMAELQIDLTKNLIELMAAYASVGGLIETEVVNLRARFTPETDPAVAESLRRIADLAMTLQKVEMDVRLGQAEARRIEREAQALHPASAASAVHHG